MGHRGRPIGDNTERIGKRYTNQGGKEGWGSATIQSGKANAIQIKGAQRGRNGDNTERKSSGYQNQADMIVDKDIWWTYLYIYIYIYIHLYHLLYINLFQWLRRFWSVRRFTPIRRVSSIRRLDSLQGARICAMRRGHSQNQSYPSCALNCRLEL